MSLKTQIGQRLTKNNSIGLVNSLSIALWLKQINKEVKAVSQSNNKPSILVVDDVAANRLAIKRLLQNVDANMVEASSGNEALGLAVQQKNLALILLDVQMPEMDGYEVAQFLREEPQTRHIPIIFVTAVYRDEQHMLKGYSSGAVDYISKPIIPEILMSKVQIFLELWQLRADLEHANEIAQAAADAKNQFLSTMSHEIRTPMNGVLGVAELLAATELDNTQQKYVKTILNSGELLLTILNDVLDFTKLEAGKVILEHIPFDLEKVGKEVLQLLTAYGQNTKIQVRIEYDQQTPKQFIGDPARIRQILFNLLGNAIKFTDKGHVILRCSSKQLNKSNHEVHIEVEDTGKGICIEEQNHLFESFSQANVSINREFGGTGLGLAICQQLTHLMNGQIDVTSILGKGSTFEVKIPLKVAEQQTETEKTANVDKPHQDLPQFNKHILLVEDTKINQMVAAAMLKKLGTKLTIVDDGQQAIDLWRTQHYDLIFIDCNMPNMDGFEATKIIRQYELDMKNEGQQIAPIPIVALTANATAENSRQCELAGMNSVTTKPFSLADLVEILKQHF